MKYIKSYENNAPPINQIKNYILLKGDMHNENFFSILKFASYYYDDRMEQAFINCYKIYHIDKDGSRPPLDTPQMIKLRYSTIIKKFIAQSNDINELVKLAETMLTSTKYNL